MAATTLYVRQRTEKTLQLGDSLSGNGLLDASYCKLNGSRRNSIGLCPVHMLRQSIEPDLDVSASGLMEEAAAYLE